jgi:hypothetical protein
VIVASPSSSTESTTISLDFIETDGSIGLGRYGLAAGSAIAAALAALNVL